MPRYAVQPADSKDFSSEFDLCERCAKEPAVLEAVFAKKGGVPLEQAMSVPHKTISHTSYDFAPRPMPCLSCGRILSADDD